MVKYHLIYKVIASVIADYLFLVHNTSRLDWSGRSVSDFYWLKPPLVPSVAYCQCHGISFKQFPQPWQNHGSGRLHKFVFQFRQIVDLMAKGSRQSVGELLRTPLPLYRGIQKIYWNLNTFLSCRRRLSIWSRNHAYCVYYAPDLSDEQIAKYD